MTGCDELLVAVGRARASVAEAQSRLVKPTAEAVEDAGTVLQHTTAVLKAALSPLEAHGLDPADSGRNALRGALQSLRKETARLRALLEGAAALRLGFARLLYAAACGYTARGEPATPELTRRLTLEG